MPLHLSAPRFGRGERFSQWCVVCVFHSEPPKGENKPQDLMVRSETWHGVRYKVCSPIPNLVRVGRCVRGGVLCVHPRNQQNRQEVENKPQTTLHRPGTWHAVLYNPFEHVYIVAWARKGRNLAVWVLTGPPSKRSESEYKPRDFTYRLETRDSVLYGVHKPTCSAVCVGE